MMIRLGNIYKALLAAVALAITAGGAFAAVGFTVPQLPDCPYDDTEIATNFVISAQFDNARAFGVSLDFDATATNTLELAFGVSLLPCVSSFQYGLTSSNTYAFAWMIV